VESATQDELLRDGKRVRWICGLVIAVGYVGNIFIAHTQYGFHEPHVSYPNGWALGGFPDPDAVWEEGRFHAVRPIWMLGDFLLGALSIYGGAVAGGWIVQRNPYRFRSFNALLLIASMLLGGTIAAVVNQRSAAQMMLLWCAIIGQIAPCLAVAGLVALRRRNTEPQTSRLT
jgi:hypothetical protein